MLNQFGELAMSRADGQNSQDLSAQLAECFNALYCLLTASSPTSTNAINVKTYLTMNPSRQLLSLPGLADILSFFYFFEIGQLTKEYLVVTHDHLLPFFSRCHGNNAENCLRDLSIYQRYSLDRHALLYLPFHSFFSASLLEGCVFEGKAFEKLDDKEDFRKNCYLFFLKIVLLPDDVITSNFNLCQFSFFADVLSRHFIQRKQLLARVFVDAMIIPEDKRQLRNYYRFQLFWKAMIEADVQSVRLSCVEMTQVTEAFFLLCGDIAIQAMTLNMDYLENLIILSPIYGLLPHKKQYGFGLRELAITAREMLQHELLLSSRTERKSLTVLLKSFVNLNCLVKGIKQLKKTWDQNESTPIPVNIQMQKQNDTLELFLSGVCDALRSWISHCRLMNAAFLNEWNDLDRTGVETANGRESYSDIRRTPESLADLTVAWLQKSQSGSSVLDQHPCLLRIVEWYFNLLKHQVTPVKSGIDVVSQTAQGVLSAASSAATKLFSSFFSSAPPVRISPQTLKIPEAQVTARSPESLVALIEIIEKIRQANTSQHLLNGLGELIEFDDKMSTKLLSVLIQQALSEIQARETMDCLAENPKNFSLLKPQLLADCELEQAIELLKKKLLESAIRVTVTCRELDEGWCEVTAK